jgi:iron complex outermembrane receptor protein
MSSISKAAQRRRSYLLACTILLSIFSLSLSAANAQQSASNDLPAIVVSPLDENRTRAKPVADQESGSRRAVPAVTPARRTNAVSTGTPAAAVTSSPPAQRQFSGIVGASASLITAEEIARSPAQTLQEIIAQTPGVQLTTLYGGVNGVGTTVDLRGFGAFGSANTLILINGRRLNDFDLAGVDLSTIPRDSIERIEITRGNSGAVLYGDNAVGGVINIVTKTGVGGPPVRMRVEGGFGSFNQRLGQVSVSTNAGPWSSSFFGNMIKSDGYRANNALDQRNGVGEIRYATPDFSAFLNLSGDDQRLRLPGTRIVDPSIGVDQLKTDRRGTDTPLNFANKREANITAGFTKSLWNGGQLIVDGGLRDKQQQLAFFGSLPVQSFNTTAVDAALQTWSITPRLRITNPVLGLPSTILTGIDYYDSTFRQNRGQLLQTAPYHVYDLSQQTLAGYFQQTVGILTSTDIAYGGRVQHMRLNARDTYNPNAPGAFETQANPLNTTEINTAYHVGLEHRFNEIFLVFGRAASAFRTPNVDERVSAGPAFDADFNPIPGTFALKTQTSNDVEGGFRVKAGALDLRSSLYLMNLANEIQFDPVNFFNRNLDPTRRYGSETSATLRASDTLLFRGGITYTRAVFRDGAFAGHDVPLVSRLTANAGVSWNIWQKYLVFDATARYWSSRRMDNDQANTQKLIPADATVDLKLSGEYDRFFWSASVNNVFNALYYDYAVASTFTPGRFAAYPLPGRTYMVRASATF